jgi:hypothetical protein
MYGFVFYCFLTLSKFQILSFLCIMELLHQALESTRSLILSVIGSPNDYSDNEKVAVNNAAVIPQIMCITYYVGILVNSFCLWQ